MVATYVRTIENVASYKDTVFLLFFSFGRCSKISTPPSPPNQIFGGVVVVVMLITVTVHVHLHIGNLTHLRDVYELRGHFNFNTPSKPLLYV